MRAQEVDRSNTAWDPNRALRTPGRGNGASRRPAWAPPDRAARAPRALRRSSCALLCSRGRVTLARRGERPSSAALSSATTVAARDCPPSRCATQCTKSTPTGDCEGRQRAGGRSQRRAPRYSPRRLAVDRVPRRQRAPLPGRRTAALTPSAPPFAAASSPSVAAAALRVGRPPSRATPSRFWRGTWTVHVHGVQLRMRGRRWSLP